jgi:hypothetical protein
MLVADGLGVEREAETVRGSRSLPALGVEEGDLRPLRQLPERERGGGPGTVKLTGVGDDGESNGCTGAQSVVKQGGGRPEHDRDFRRAHTSAPR